MANKTIRHHGDAYVKDVDFILSSLVTTCKELERNRYTRTCLE